jgi:hypothetical protein
MLLWGPVAAVVILALVVDGGVSRAEALDEWSGPLVLTSAGASRVLTFKVLVDPGKSASFEWLSESLQIFAGPLLATVSGSTVTGRLIPTSGLALQIPDCCRPCDFTGIILGNQVNGTLDPESCASNTGTGTFTLFKRN